MFETDPANIQTVREQTATAAAAIATTTRKCNLHLTDQTRQLELLVVVVVVERCSNYCCVSLLACLVGYARGISARYLANE